MLFRHPDELACDFAETYHIYNIHSLPGRYAATLACGLRPDSRVMTALSGAPVSQSEMLMARLVDDVGFIAWANTKDAQKGYNRPKSVLYAMMHPNAKSQTQSFNSAEEYEEARRRILEGVD